MIGSTFFNLLVIAVLGYAGIAGALYAFQRNLMYHPDQAIDIPQRFGVTMMRELRIETPDGYALHAWWKEPEDAAKPVLVYFHGNAGGLGDRAEKVTDYLEAGFGVLLVTYRYNAGTGGEPSEEALFVDGRSALEFVRAQGINDDRVILYGESLGTGIAVKMASERASKAVVLEAPYSSIADVAGGRYWFVPVRLLLKDHFDSQAIIRDINAPLLIVHGGRDRVIQPKYGRKLFEAAVEPKRFHFLEEAHHTNLYDFGMAALVLGFLADMDQPQPETKQSE